MAPLNSSPRLLQEISAQFGFIGKPEAKHFQGSDAHRGFACYEQRVPSRTGNTPNDPTASLYITPVSVHTMLMAQLDLDSFQFVFLQFVELMGDLWVAECWEKSGDLCLRQRKLCLNI